jgi:hypothetical protein
VRLHQVGGPADSQPVSWVLGPQLLECRGGQRPHTYSQLDTKMWPVAKGGSWPHGTKVTPEPTGLGCSQLDFLLAFFSVGIPSA